MTGWCARTWIRSGENLNETFINPFHRARGAKLPSGRLKFVLEIILQRLLSHP